MLSHHPLGQCDKLAGKTRWLIEKFLAHLPSVVQAMGGSERSYLRQETCVDGSRAFLCSGFTVDLRTSDVMQTMVILQI